MIVKAKHTVQGANPRFVVTSLTDDPKTLYAERYCARGEICTAGRTLPNCRFYNNCKNATAIEVDQ
jgi:hypothetical protein